MNKMNLAKIDPSELKTTIRTIITGNYSASSIIDKIEITTTFEDGSVLVVYTHIYKSCFRKGEAVSQRRVVYITVDGSRRWDMIVS